MPPFQLQNLVPEPYSDPGSHLVELPAPPEPAALFAAQTTRMLLRPMPHPQDPPSPARFKKFDWQISVKF